MALPKKFLIYNDSCEFCTILAKHFQKQCVTIIPNSNIRKIRKLFPNINLESIQRDVHYIENKKVYSKAAAASRILGEDFYKIYKKYPKILNFAYYILKKNKWIINIFIRSSA